VPKGLWKVVLSEDRTQPDQPDLFTRFGFYVGNDKRDKEWTDSAFLSSIGNLENQINLPNSLKYDFLNNLSIERAALIKNGALIREVKKNLVEQIITLPSAPLLADFSSSPMTDGKETNLGQPSSVKVFPITSIESIMEETGGFIISDISKIAPNDRACTFHDKPSHISTSKVDVLGRIVLPYGISQISSSQDSTIKTRNSGLGQIDITQIDSAQNAWTSFQLFHKNLEIFQIRKLIDFSTTVSRMDNEIGKISLPSSVSSEQSFNVDLLLSDHDNTSLLTSIYSTAQSIWHTTTPINLNFEITNLPTGQLAEGTITSYNTNGTPKTATITIDDDANGIGWFLDTTPQDASEFRPGDGGTGGLGDYYIADPNSPAAGKYDILTAILHEMGHTLGIINGYSEFDKHIKNGKFITTDSPNGAKITLTPDGSHLDSTLYPYDLMNTSLKPGIRKLPSTLDLSLLNTLWS
jgi:hypothetical protein